MFVHINSESASNSLEISLFRFSSQKILVPGSPFAGGLCRPQAHFVRNRNDLRYLRFPNGIIPYIAIRQLRKILKYLYSLTSVWKMEKSFLKVFQSSVSCCPVIASHFHSACLQILELLNTVTLGCFYAKKTFPSSLCFYWALYRFSFFLLSYVWFGTLVIIPWIATSVDLVGPNPVIYSTNQPSHGSPPHCTTQLILCRIKKVT